MAYRVILIENECSLHLKLNNLLINKGEGDIWIPLDDISMIVLDNLKIQFTARLMSTLAEHNIGVIFCNLDHLPIGFYSSYDNHSRIPQQAPQKSNAKAFFSPSFPSTMLAVEGNL